MSVSETTPPGSPRTAREKQLTQYGFVLPPLLITFAALFIGSFAADGLWRGIILAGSLIVAGTVVATCQDLSISYFFHEEWYREPEPYEALSSKRLYPDGWSFSARLVYRIAFWLGWMAFAALMCWPAQGNWQTGFAITAVVLLGFAILDFIQYIHVSPVEEAYRERLALQKRWYKMTPAVRQRVLERKGQSNAQGEG